MRLRPFISTCALALAVTLSAPALSRDHHRGRDMRPDWNERDRDPAYANVRRGPEFGYMRQQWLADCRYRVAQRGGVAVGGPPPISGPVPGGPIARDACETAFDNYFAGMPEGYAGAGYGYPGGQVMVPVTIPAPPCVEHVITRDIPARRVIPRRPAPVKRVPDKRIRIN